MNLMRSYLRKDPRTDTAKFSIVQETDVKSSLTRGLKEYLETLEFSVFGDRVFRFEKVFDQWSDFEEDSAFPSAFVSPIGTGEYDDSKNTPSLDLREDLEDSFPANFYLVNPAEFIQTLSVEIWATDVIERMALVSMVESAMNPVEWMYGMALILPHYFNAAATYELRFCNYEDSQTASMQRNRQATLTVEARVPLIRVHQYPTARLLSDVTVG